MTLHANGTLAVKSWDEKPYSEIAGQPKLTRAAVVYTYHGDIEAEGSVEYLMCYSSNNIAHFIGYEQITGRLGNRSGRPPQRGDHRHQYGWPRRRHSARW